jgi:hypothetical protein
MQHLFWIGNGPAQGVRADEVSVFVKTAKDPLRSYLDIRHIIGIRCNCVKLSIGSRDRNSAVKRGIVVVFISHLLSSIGIPRQSGEQPLR